MHEDHGRICFHLFRLIDYLYSAFHLKEKKKEKENKEGSDYRCLVYTLIPKHRHTLTLIKHTQHASLLKPH